MATKAADQDASGALKYKTWVLKVFIHCEGCKKKVKKVLQAIDGVYETTIDSQQHKVTVTGSVDAETLIKKLTKSRKYVELWPEKKEKKPGKPKNNEKQKDEEEAGDNHDPNNNSAENPELAAAKNGGAGGVKGSARDDQPPTGDQMGGESEEPDTAESSGGGSNGGKKKKKKGQKGNPGPNGDASGDTLLPLAHPDQAPPMTSINLSPPNQPMYPFSHMCYGPPLYGVSHNTTYPSSGSSFYTPTVLFNENGPPAPPSDPIEKINEDDYYDYDDEQGGCSIM
ncbi:heavy metal-associated isoprenylated plant protein 35-like [Durio zibethinus]|uniref:Heavy metal-associated isoprenylated plant protein 35-like n=1 Tax=Durio zibethinus TaxID=66656 RepID=A0A6P6A3X6_DURZI|nr:heavy metal-associated isoprenylated plant protein 35-like [Durio zibethinus]